MKILYAGNIANIGYQVAKQLRKNNIHVDLLIEKNPIVEQDPIKQDPELSNTYPSWIYFYEKNSSGWKRNIIKTMKKYDLVISQYELNIFAYLSRRPMICQILGNDLRGLALSNSMRGFLFRRALRKAKAVLFGSPLELSLLTNMRVRNTVFLPLFADLNFFKPSEATVKEFADKLVVFHPTYLWEEKGNSLLIKGFADFVKNDPNALLIIVDRGPDSTKIHDLVGELGINDKVRFLKGPLNSVELRDYYRMADVIVDQFLVPEIGGIGREALCCQKPLLTRFDEEGYKKLFGESPPVINVSDQSDIPRNLGYMKDPKARLELGKKGRDWICKHHSLDTYSKKILIMCEAVLNKKKTDQIRQKLSEIP